MTSFVPFNWEESLPTAARLRISVRGTPEAEPPAPSPHDAGVAIDNLFMGDAVAAGRPLIRILVADSRPMVVRGLTELINARKPLMEVVAAAQDYARTIELSQSLRPEVVLFSFFRDSIDAIEALATLVDRCRAKVLLIKGQDDAAPVGRAMEIGARGVVLAEDTSEAIVQAIVRVSRAAVGPGTAWLDGLARLPVPTHGRGTPRHDSQQARDDRLTGRERQLIRAIVDQPSAKYLAIGAMLGISEHTVHNHLTSIYRKLGLVNRIELLVYAMQHLIDGNDEPRRRGAGPD